MMHPLEDLSWWLQAAAAFAWLILLTAAASGLGRILFTLLKIPEEGLITAASRRILETGLGIGLLGQITLLAGLAGIFGIWIPLLAVLTGAAGWYLHPQRVRDWRLCYPGAGVVLVILLLIPLFMCVLPETAFDALRTHLWMSAELSRSGAMPADPTNWNVFIPSIAVTWFANLYLLGGETAVHFGHWMLGALSILLLVYGIRDPSRGRGPVLAGAILAGMPVVAWEMSTAYVDCALTFYLMAGFIVLLAFRRTGDQRWILPGGLFTGLALASKYNGLAWLPAAVICLAIWSRLQGHCWRTICKNIIIFLSIAGIILLPWLARNFQATGNPFFPLPVPGLDSPHITAELIQHVRQEQLSFGKGRDWKALLFLPWNLNVHPELFRGSPGWLVFLATGLWWWRRRWLDQEDHTMLFLFLYGILIWFWTGQEIRYLMPALPAAAWVAAAPGFNGPKKGEIWLKYGWSVLLAAQLITHTPLIHQRLFPRVAFQLTPGMLEWQVMTGALSRDDYRTRKNPIFPVYRWANHNLKPPVRILSFDACASWSRWTMLYALSAEGSFTGKVKNPEEALLECKKRRLTHTVVNMDWLPPGTDPARAMLFFQPYFQEKYLRLIYQEGNVRLYGIRTPSSLETTDGTGPQK